MDASMRLCQMLSFLCLLASSSFAIRLENNSYTDIVIAINRYVEEDPSLIETIAEMVTDASPVLYHATKKRAYFGEVTIVVPETWSDKEEYLPASPRETFSQANVRINPPEIVFGKEKNLAYTENPLNTCGQPGLYINITPKRMTLPIYRTRSPPHKMFVHEWGHLRWGLYDEYFHNFFGPDFDGKPARCVQKIKPYRTSTGVWKYNTTVGISASIMWKQYYNEVVEFCDDSDNATVKHYRMANNAQNRFCDLRSSWEVMRGTEDFREGRNLPREISSVKPTIRVVHKKSAADAIVLVLDISNSMYQGKRLINLRQATKTYINEVKVGSFVGIVHFNDIATIKQNLTKVTDQKSRDKISEKLPSVSDLRDQTSIGGGLLKALEVLRHANTARKQLLVVSDGTETTNPTIMDEHVQQSIESAKVKIHTIAIGEAADDKLASLSDKTGGMSFFHDEVSHEPSGLQEAVGQLAESDSSDDDRQYQVSRQMMTINGKSSKTVTVDFDDGVGRNTLFNFFWSLKDFRPRQLRLFVKSPARKVYRYRGARGPIYCNKDYMMCELKVQGEVQPGQWKIKVGNRGKKSLSMTWEVLSHKPVNADNAITLETYISKSEVTYPQTVTITASLMKGNRPVIDAVVAAVVTRPSKQPVTIHLRDNGAGPDLLAYDGLYSATFTHFSGTGRYNVKVIASQDYTNNRYFTYSSEVMGTMMKGKRARLGVRLTLDDLPPEGPGINKPESGFLRELTPRFTRIQSPGMFAVNSYQSSKDVIPPSRIIDLRGRVVSENNAQVTWTAPGDDMDTGEASAYSIRVSTSFDDLVDSFDSQREILPENVVSSGFSISKPKMAGLTEKFNFSTPVKAKMLFVAVKTRDQSGQLSGLSNVIYLKFDDTAPEKCNCPVETSLEKAICEHEFVVVGTIGVITKDNMQLHPGAEYLKANIRFPPSLSLPVKMNINRKTTNGCLCPPVPEAGQRYVMSGNIRQGQLEVTNQSFLQLAPSDMATMRATVHSVAAGC